MMVMGTTHPSPTPRANVSTVEAPVAQPGQAYWKIAARQKNSPHGFQKRANPVTAVSPVARV